MWRALWCRCSVPVAGCQTCAGATSARRRGGNLRCDPSRPRPGSTSRASRPYRCGPSPPLTARVTRWCPRGRTPGGAILTTSSPASSVAAHGRSPPTWATPSRWCRCPPGVVAPADAGSTCRCYWRGKRRPPCTRRASMRGWPARSPSARENSEERAPATGGGRPQACAPQARVARQEGRCWWTTWSPLAPRWRPPHGRFRRHSSRLAQRFASLPLRGLAPVAQGKYRDHYDDHVVTPSESKGVMRTARRGAHHHVPSCRA